MTDLRIQPLSAHDDNGFRQAYAVYHDAILPSEQRTEAELRSLTARPDYRFLVAVSDGLPIGMSVSYVPPGDDFWLFEYAAVAPAERGGGIGANLFVASRLMAGQGRVGLVEADAAYADSGSEQARRLAFYGRLGCRIIAGLDYLLPLRTYGVPPPMVLLALAPRETASVPRDTVERWLRRLYVDAYHQKTDDPRIAEMVSGLPAEVKLAEIQPSPGPAKP
ncbi:MAG: GNAT family N-acetyltransferase [Hyphomonadaceae bacterium]|nr:GNAT family N-acetyltransferase [Hyphomonadaceae bacterium]